jgi:hypothetical protein
MRYLFYATIISAATPTRLAFAQSTDLQAGLIALGVPLVSGEIVSDGRTSWQMFSSDGQRVAIRTDRAAIAGPTEWRAIGRAVACLTAARSVLSGDANEAAEQARQIGTLGEQVRGVSSPVLSAVSTADNMVASASTGAGNAALNAAERAGGTAGEVAGMARSLMGVAGTSAADIGSQIVKSTTGIDIAKLRRSLAAVDAAAASTTTSAHGVTRSVSRLTTALQGNAAGCDALPELGTSSAQLANSAQQLIAPLHAGVSSVRSVASLVPNAAVEQGLTILTNLDARVVRLTQPMGALAARSRAAAATLAREGEAMSVAGTRGTQLVLERAVSLVERDAKALLVVAPFLGTAGTRARGAFLEVQRSRNSVASSPTTALTGLVRAREAADGFVRTDMTSLSRAAGKIVQRASARDLAGLVSVAGLQFAAQNLLRAQQAHAAPKQVYMALSQLSGAQDRFDTRRTLTLALITLAGLLVAIGAALVLAQRRRSSASLPTR